MLSIQRTLIDMLFKYNRNRLKFLLWVLGKLFSFLISSLIFCKIGILTPIWILFGDIKWKKWYKVLDSEQVLINTAKDTYTNYYPVISFSVCIHHWIHEHTNIYTLKHIITHNSFSPLLKEECSKLRKNVSLLSVLETYACV